MNICFEKNHSYTTVFENVLSDFNIYISREKGLYVPRKIFSWGISSVFHEKQGITVNENLWVQRIRHENSAIPPHKTMNQSNQENRPYLHIHCIPLEIKNLAQTVYFAVSNLKICLLLTNLSYHILYPSLFEFFFSHRYIGKMFCLAMTSGI